MRWTILLFLAVNGATVRDQPLQPSWSPDHKILATTKVPLSFATPEGADYSLLLNGELLYPPKVKRSWFAARDQWHTFLSELTWSPDSRAVAFVEKVYRWQYSDPYNRDFDGTVSQEHVYLAIVSREGKATGYELDPAPQEVQLSWPQAQRIVINGRAFNLETNPPEPIE